MKKLCSKILTLILTCGLCFSFAGCKNDMHHAIIQVEFDWPLITTDSDAIFRVELSEENELVELTVQYGQGHVGQGHKMTAEVVYYDEKYEDFVTVLEVLSMGVVFYPAEESERPSSPMQPHDPILERGKYIFRYEISNSAKRLKIEPYSAYLNITVV